MKNDKNKDVHDAPWIKELRNQLNKLDTDPNSDIWSKVTLNISQADARRLLYVLDLVRGIEEPPNVPAADHGIEAIAGAEMWLLATGAMEG